MDNSGREGRGRTGSAGVKAQGHLIGRRLPNGQRRGGSGVCFGGRQEGGPASATTSAPIKRSSSRRFTPSIRRFVHWTRDRRVATNTPSSWVPARPSKELV